MKEAIKESFKQLVANRYLLVLSSMLLLVTIAFAIYIAVTVQPSELQLVTHYSAFGITHLYRDQWYYLLLFGVFGIFVALIHIVIGVKLLIIKGPSLALLYVWLGLALVLIAWVTSIAVMNVNVFWSSL